MNQYLELLPARTRQILYVVYGCASVGLSATSAYYLAALGFIPTWVIGALAALGAVGAGPTFVAASKVNGLKDQPAAPTANFGPVDNWTPGVNEDIPPADANSPHMGDAVPDDSIDSTDSTDDQPWQALDALDDSQPIADTTGGVK